MEKITFENGGCILTWNIENFPCLKPVDTTISPTFNIDASKKTQWIFELYKCGDCRLNLHLRRCDIFSSNVTISYSCALVPDYMQRKEYTGLLTCAKFSTECICNSEYVTNEKAPKHLTIYCYLRAIDDTNFVTNQYRFRSVVEAEQRRFKYDVPNTSSWEENQKLSFTLPSASNAQEAFEVTLSKFDVFNSDCVSVEICCVKTSKNGGIFLSCKLLAFDGDSNAMLKAIHNHEFLRENEKWRFPSDISFKNLKNYKNDVLTLEFELIVSEHKTSTWMEDFSIISSCRTKMALRKENIDLSNDLKCLYVDQKCPDVEISVEGKNFKAHKAILRARSPVFMAMFHYDTQEKGTNKVEISDLDSETVDKMLLFIYSETLQEQEWNNITKLYAASDKYQILDLKNKCALVLTEKLSPKNTIEALALADMHCDSDFFDTVQDFIVTHEEKILQSEEWKTFMSSNSKVACKILYKAWLYRSNRL